MNFMNKPKEFTLEERRNGKKGSVDSVIGTDYAILFQKGLMDFMFSASYPFQHLNHLI